MGGVTVQSQKELSVCLKQYPVKPFCFLINHWVEHKTSELLKKAQLCGISHQCEMLPSS